MKRAFFFQGDNLLLPEDFPESQICEGVPLERAEDFESADIFEIPAPVTLKVVSLPPQEPGRKSLHENCKLIPMRQVLAMYATGTINGDSAGISALLRACHIAQWRQTSRFCGSCGTENCDAAAEEPVFVPATPLPYPAPPVPQFYPVPPPHRVCPKCGREEYPRICPAIIVIITDDQNRILLAHNRKFRKGVYSHLSGFNEAGESLEETIEREVFEEANIKIKDIEYVKSQAWPFPNSLMIGFRARYASGALKPDGDEIEDVRWFTKDNLPEVPAEGSLSRWLINQWLKQ